MPWRPEDRAISDAMVGYWTNFAKTGDPNGGNLPNWPKFTPASETVMVFSGPPHVGALPDPQHFDAIDRYMAWRRTPEGAQK
jgi:para-nitrobenzyl esterase